MPGISEDSKPLGILMEKNTAWHWGKKQQESFDILKKKFQEAPILTFYDTNPPVTLSVDASSYAVGAVMMQESRLIA